MVQKVWQRYAGRRRWRVLPLFVAMAFFAATLVQLPASAASTRLEPRYLTMNSARPGDITDYTLSWNYTSSQPVGSIVLDFCIDPIPYMPCDLPAGGGR